MRKPRRRAAPSETLVLDGQIQDELLFLANLFRPHIKWIRKAAAGFPAEWGLFGEMPLRPGARQVTRRLSPTEMLERCGNAVLYHPRFWEEIHVLAQNCAKPFVLMNIGLDKVQIGVDELKDTERARRAARELRRVVDLLTRRDPAESRSPASFRNQRLAEEYEQLLEDGKLRKTALGILAKRHGLPEGTIETLISRGRESLGRSPRRLRRRGKN